MIDAVPNDSQPELAPRPVLPLDDASLLTYATWATDQTGPGRWHNLLILPDRGDTGALCIKCGQPGARQFIKSYAWYPRYISVLAVLGCVAFMPVLLILLIVTLMIQKKGKVSFQLCELHARNRLKKIAITVVAAIVGIATLLISVGLLMNSRASESWLYSIGMLIGFALVITAAVVGDAARPLKVAKIEQKVLRLKGAGLAYLDTLPPTLPPGER